MYTHTQQDCGSQDPGWLPPATAEKILPPSPSHSSSPFLLGLAKPPPHPYPSLQGTGIAGYSYGRGQAAVIQPGGRSLPPSISKGQCKVSSAPSPQPLHWLGPFHREDPAPTRAVARCWALGARLLPGNLCYRAAAAGIHQQVKHYVP